MRANGARYRDVVIQFFLSKSQDMDDTTRRCHMPYDSKNSWIAARVVSCNFPFRRSELAVRTFFFEAFRSLRFAPTTSKEEIEPHLCINVDGKFQQKSKAYAKRMEAIYPIFMNK